MTENKNKIKIGQFSYRHTYLEDKKVYTIFVIDANGIEVPHPVTDFLREFRSDSMSAERERQVASCIRQFLNYVRDMTLSGDEDFTELYHNGVLGLNFIHGSRFLDNEDDQINKRGQRVKRDTVDRKEYMLTDFYVFFQKKGVISSELIIPSYRNEKGDLKNASPFVRKRGNSQKEPVIKDLRDFGENRQQILVEFIDTAKSLKGGSTIALGMAFQAFGGLRRGEVVNQTTSSVLQIGMTLILDVKDRQTHLFAHKKNTAKEEVKKERPQDLLPSEYLITIYNDHLAWLKSFKKQVTPLVKDALFVNRFGRPLTGKGYEKIYKRVVTKYLKVLLAQERYDDYNFLTSKPFNTHTLRGVFTNICLDDIGMSVRQTANARGDTYDTTVAEYQEQLTGRQKMDRAIGQLAKAVVDAEASKDFIAKMNMKE